MRFKPRFSVVLQIFLLRRKAVVISQKVGVLIAVFAAVVYGCGTVAWHKCEEGVTFLSHTNESPMIT